jgi:hypothetical protein
MKLLTYFMIVLALCASTHCWAMQGYYGRPAAPASGKVWTQQEYQQYLAQQAQQKAGASASAASAAQTQPVKPVAPAVPAPTAQPAPAPERKTKIRFSEERAVKVPQKYPSEIAEEDAAAASVEPIEDEDKLAERQRTAIRHSKWSTVNDQTAAEAELKQEQEAGTSDVKKGMSNKESKAAREARMKELGIPIEKPKRSFW